MDFRTQLPPEDETTFRAWAKREVPTFALDDPLSDYDMRGFWKTAIRHPEEWNNLAKQGLLPKEKTGMQAGKRHFVDYWKTPYHPTFSTQSKYSTPERRGGEWGQERSGKWMFTPGPENTKNYTIDQLKNYFAEKDPEAILKPPLPTVPNTILMYAPK